jgi:phage replication-related protein YjqB (UPF0714/DUF867 family)
MANFKASEHVTDLRGKQYLEVKWRLVWFRDEHPQGSIKTEVLNYEPLTIIASVYDAGQLLATGHGSAKARPGAVWTGRELEKAETAAIGRALAHAGYGTQFTEEDEGDNLADSPIEVEKPRSNFGMTLEQAKTIANKEGVLYTDLDTAQLASIQNNTKAPADKRMAAAMILADRNQKAEETK